VKPKPPPQSAGQRKPKSTGNYIDGFVKKMFGQVLVFVDFLTHYADPKFVAQIDLKKLRPAPTHYIGAKGDERIVDLVFQCALKNGDGTLTAVIIFEHQSTSLKAIPEKLIRYISAVCLKQIHTDRVWIDALITMFRECGARKPMTVTQYQCDNRRCKQHIVEYNHDRLVGHRA
jgi:hypothetical protein